MDYKRIIPCILIKDGNVIEWFDDETVISNNIIAHAVSYAEKGADELIVLDLSDTPETHAKTLDCLRKLTLEVTIPIIVGGDINNMEDIDKILATGVRRAILNMSKESSRYLLKDAAEKYGRENIGASFNDFNSLFKTQKAVREYATELVFLHHLDFPSVMNVTDIPSVLVSLYSDMDMLTSYLEYPTVKGLSGKFVSRPGIDINDLKREFSKRGITFSSFESKVSFSQFKLLEKDSEGLVPVIVQHYKTKEVLMMAYMNEEAFMKTLRTGKMTYWSRSRNAIWVKGETSGHFQYVKSLNLDCDNDTILAKVEQIGAACHTGNPSCFFNTIAGTEDNSHSSQQTMDMVFKYIIAERNKSAELPPVNSKLMYKGLDPILKQLGAKYTELLVTAKNSNPTEFRTVLADTLFNTMLLMAEKNVTWEEIYLEFTNKI